MSTIDELVSIRRRALIGVLIGFGAWQAADLADRFGGDALPRSIHAALGAVTLLGALIYIAGLLWLSPVFKFLKADPELRLSLNDEFVQHVRLRASSFGFGAVLAVQAVPIVAAVAGVPLAGDMVARLTILVGVTSALSAFLVFERG